MLRTLQLTVAMIIVLFAVQSSAAEMQALKTEQDRLNYALGVTFVRNLMQRGGTVNLDLVVQGMLDVLTDERLLLSESEIRVAGTAKPSEKGKSDNHPAVLTDKKDGTAGDVLKIASADTSSNSMARQIWEKPVLSIDQADRTYPTGSSKRAQALIDRARAAKANMARDKVQSHDSGTGTK